MNNEFNATFGLLYDTATSRNILNYGGGTARKESYRNSFEQFIKEKKGWNGSGGEVLIPFVQMGTLAEFLLSFCEPQMSTNFIFSVTGDPIWREQKRNEGTFLVPNSGATPKIHALDLSNWSVIQLKGSIKHPDQNFYDNRFISILNRYAIPEDEESTDEVIRYVNHHYDRSENKRRFLQKIDSFFERTCKLFTDEKLNGSAKPILLKWYNVEREKLNEISVAKAVEQKPNVSVSVVEPALTNTPVEKRTKQTVMEAFNNIDKKGWKYAFKDEIEYHLFVNLLCLYFEQKHYDLPKVPIITQKRCNTRLASVLGELHKELSYNDKLKNDIAYFDIVRTLAAFEGKSNAEIYKDLTR